MTQTKSLFDLTATDLMSGVAVALREWMSLREAADELFRAGVHGAPVVDAGGRCVGVLSMSDLARWAVRQDDPPPAHPRTCGHQAPYRPVGGREATLCTLPGGACTFQAAERLSDGCTVQVCREPHSVCLDWQMVDMEALPVADVRHYMTTEPVTLDPHTPLRDIARRMLDAGVSRVIVTDSRGAPVGVVSVTDLMAAVADAVPD
jgi:CBS domain-containing protein